MVACAGFDQSWASQYSCDACGAATRKGSGKAPLAASSSYLVIFLVAKRRSTRTPLAEVQADFPPKSEAFEGWKNRGIE